MSTVALRARLRGIAAAIRDGKLAGVAGETVALVLRDAVNALQVADADHNLRALQVSQPWSIWYSRDFRANPQSHKDFAHASVHVSKANGKIAAFIDDLDHRRESTEQARIADYLADLVICALRMANTFPGEKIDLQAAVERRISAKNQEPAHDPSSPCGVMVSNDADLQCVLESDHEGIHQLGGAREERDSAPCCPHPSSRHFVYQASITGAYVAGCRDCDCKAEPERERR